MNTRSLLPLVLLACMENDPDLLDAYDEVLLLSGYFEAHEASTCPTIGEAVTIEVENRTRDPLVLFPVDLSCRVSTDFLVRIEPGATEPLTTATGAVWAVWDTYHRHWLPELVVDGAVLDAPRQVSLTEPRPARW